MSCRSPGEVLIDNALSPADEEIFDLAAEESRVVVSAVSDKLPRRRQLKGDGWVLVVVSDPRTIPQPAQDGSAQTVAFVWVRGRVAMTGRGW